MKKTLEYIYLLSNKSMPDIYKIGWTAKTPSYRAVELYTTGVPTPFFIERFWTVANGLKAEQHIHRFLNEYRLNAGREFFRITSNDLLHSIDNELSRFTVKQSDFDRVLKQYEDNLPEIARKIIDLDEKIRKQYLAGEPYRQRWMDILGSKRWFKGKKKERIRQELIAFRAKSGGLDQLSNEINELIKTLEKPPVGAEVNGYYLQLCKEARSIHETL